MTYTVQDMIVIYEKRTKSENGRVKLRGKIQSHSYSAIPRIRRKNYFKRERKSEKKKKKRCRKEEIVEGDKIVHLPFIEPQTAFQTHALFIKPFNCFFRANLREITISYEARYLKKFE